MSSLLAIAPPLVAFWGWASFALAVADQGSVVALSIVGYAGSILAKRAPRAAATMEIVAGGMLVIIVVLVADASRFAFTAVGALVVVGARAITEASRSARG